MTVGDPSWVDGWMAGTPPPVILRHDRGLRRGEAAGFNARRKASGAVTQACPPAMEGQPPTTTTIISPLQLVPPHALKPIGNSNGSPFIPDSIHHKRKKGQDLRPRYLRHRPGRVARYARTPALKGPTAKAVAGGVQAVAGAIHHDYVPMNRLGIKIRILNPEGDWGLIKVACGWRKTSDDSSCS